MFIGLFIIAGVVLAYYYDGSVINLFARAMADYPAHLTIPGAQGAISTRMWSCYIFVYGFGGVMWPHLFMRAYAVKDPRFFNRYPLWLFGLYIVIVPTIIIIGLGGRMVMEVPAADQILPQLLIATIPLPLAALLLSGAVAGSMSTVDGQNHGIAAMITHDFVQRVTTITEERAILITRILVVVVAGIGLIAGYLLPTAPYTLDALSSGIALVLAPASIGALVLWKRATAAGAIASLWVGLVVAILTETVYRYPLDMHSGIWAFVVSGLVFVGVSLVTSPLKRQSANSYVGGE